MPPDGRTAAASGTRVERSFAWMARFRRLARDYERLPTTLAGMHFIPFACLMFTRVVLRFQAC